MTERSDAPLSEQVERIIETSSHCMVEDGAGNLHSAVKAKIHDLRALAVSETLPTRDAVLKETGTLENQMRALNALRASAEAMWGPTPPVSYPEDLPDAIRALKEPAPQVSNSADEAPGIQSAPVVAALTIDALEASPPPTRRNFDHLRKRPHDPRLCLPAFEEGWNAALHEAEKATTAALPHTLATGETPRKVERIHVGLVDGIPRSKEDGSYVYYYDYQKLERELAEAVEQTNKFAASLTDESRRRREAEARPSATERIVEEAGDITTIADNLTADRVGLHRMLDAMETKLHAKHLDGRGGWHNDCSISLLEQMLKDHIDKPWTDRNLVDIANFCMMLWNRHNPVVATDDTAKRPDGPHSP